MPITNTQGKALLAAAVIIVASYVVHSLVAGVTQANYIRQQQAQAARQKAAKAERRNKAKQAAKEPVVIAPPVVSALTPTPPPAAPEAAPSSPKATEPTPPPPSQAFLNMARLAGFWQGSAALPGRGVCAMRFELRRKGDETERFTGYSTVTCGSVKPLMSKDRADPASGIVNRMDPEASVLTGSIENGGIRFHVDKAVGADSSGCTASSFTVTPFGTNLIDAAWTEQTCAGGHIILRKVRF